MMVLQRLRSKAYAATLPILPKQRRWQRLVQGAWIMLALALLLIFMVNLPVFFQYARTICTLPDAGSCPTYQLTPAYAHIFERLHFSIAVAQGFLAALCVAVSVVYWLLGLLIFLRKSQEPIGLLVSLLLVLFGSTGFIGFNLTVQTPPLFQFLAQFITHWLMWPAMLVFFFTFPTGRFTPRWTWAAFAPFFVVAMLATIPGYPDLVPFIALILASLLPVGVQTYRYVWVYNAVQRQQTRWFVFGLSVVFLLILIQGILEEAAKISIAANSWYQLLYGPFWLIPWTLLLLAVSIPILRYRLWEIDVIINRTLVYGSLTLLLGSLYVGLILALQTLMKAITGDLSEEPLVIVSSTLVIAALFRPLRQRIQDFIDRRFYRRKYDAAKIMAAFSHSLRHEVELEQLREQLLAVVQETMQPAFVSLWISPLKRQAFEEETTAESLS